MSIKHIPTTHRDTNKHLFETDKKLQAKFICKKKKFNVFKAVKMSPIANVFSSTTSSTKCNLFFHVCVCFGQKFANAITCRRTHYHLSLMMIMMMMMKRKKGRPFVDYHHHNVYTMVHFVLTLRSFFLLVHTTIHTYVCRVSFIFFLSFFYLSIQNSYLRYYYYYHHHHHHHFR